VVKINRIIELIFLNISLQLILVYIMFNTSLKIMAKIYKLKFWFDNMEVPESAELVYVKPEEKIYEIAVDKDRLDWKDFLYNLINDEGLDPWDVDVSILTQKYLIAVREINIVDFDVTGKFLTIAVFLLKTKAENLVEKDLRGIEEQIARVQDIDENFYEGWETLEDLDMSLEDLTLKRKKEKYSIKVRNPIARKRKVNIFDLINLLEKTFKQSNKRRENFFSRNEDIDYEGPIYEEKPIDLKQIIADLHDLILREIDRTNSHITFDHVIGDVDSTKELLGRFMSLLYLHNQNKVYLKQKIHFDSIEIHKSESIDENN